jgi:hypothetical protein
MEKTVLYWPMLESTFQGKKARLMDTERTFQYDTAISFLNDDLGKAQALRDGLSPQLKVFLYADHRQQEIAGTDGLAAFRSAFRVEFRLTAVKPAPTRLTGHPSNREKCSSPVGHVKR